MEEKKDSLNFIEQIIENDLSSGKVTSTYTRFPPEPNGYLHIGHAKSICLNFGIKNQYHGKCNLRFDDTNPSKEDVEYVNSIIADIKWLGFEYDKLLYTSDYFDQLYEWAKMLNICFNLIFAIARLDFDVPTEMPNLLAISLCESSSTTYILNTVLYTGLNFCRSSTNRAAFLSSCAMRSSSSSLSSI